MNQERVKMIIKNMELLIHTLKQEMESLSEDILEKEDAAVGPYVEDYDEVF